MNSFFNELVESSLEIGFYRDLYKDIDLEKVTSKKSFKEKIPTIDKDKLLNFYEEGNFLLGSSESEGGVVGRPTSGTTSDMACYYRTKEEIDNHISRVDSGAGHFIDEEDTVLVATTFSLAPILFNQFLELGCTVTSASPFDFGRTSEVFQVMNCNTLVCSPSIAMKISKKLVEKGYKGLEKFYLVSSGLSPMARNRLKECFPDAEIMLQYGLAETGILLKQCEKLRGSNKYHTFDSEDIFYEFLNDEDEEAEPGEIAEIVVTKNSSNTPLIRYRVGDLFEVGGRCDCGGRVYTFMGRKEDKFKIKGVTVFKDRIENALEPVKESMADYQVIIDEEEGDEFPKPKIIVRAELEKEDDAEKIRKVFSENFQVADDYSWSKGVEMSIFAPVEVENVVFEDRKFRRVKDKRFD